MNFVSSVEPVGPVGPVELIEPVEPVEPKLEGQCWTSEEGWSVRIGLKKNKKWDKRSGLRRKDRAATKRKKIRQKDRVETKWHGWDEEPGWNEQRKIMILWSEKDSVKTHSFTPGPCPTKHYAECVNKFDMFSQLKKIHLSSPQNNMLHTWTKLTMLSPSHQQKVTPFPTKQYIEHMKKVGMLSNSKKWFLTYKMINSNHAVDILSHFLNKFTSPWTLQTSTLKVWRTLTYWVI